MFSNTDTTPHALELKLHKTTLKMTTGSSNLDSLIDGVEEGSSYLFYGNNSVVLDAMVYRFLVNCVLPVNQKHGFESMGVYEEMAIELEIKLE